MLYHHIAKFGDQVTIGIVVVEMFLVCHVIKQDHIVKGSGDYEDKSAAAPTSPMVFFCHVRSRDQRTK